MGLLTHSQLYPKKIMCTKVHVRVFFITGKIKAEKCPTENWACIQQWTDLNKPVELKWLRDITD